VGKLLAEQRQGLVEDIATWMVDQAIDDMEWAEEVTGILSGELPALADWDEGEIVEFMEDHEILEGYSKEDYYDRIEPIDDED
jgi:hypothetical protein